MNKWQACPLFQWCPNKTATCRVCLPDSGCYWYRWFKELIQEDNESNNPLKDINPKPIPTKKHKFKYKRK